MSRTVLIAAHGSHLDPRSSEPVRRHAEALRRSGRFDRVLTGFWKEEPALCRALDGIEVDHLVVVPFFMADGYFTRTVISRELSQGFRGELTMTRPLGVHPRVADLVIGAAASAGAGPADTVIVLGHGTPRSESSARAAACHAEAVADSGRFARVLPLYLDQEPSIATFKPETLPGRVFIVPLFVSDGWHVGTSIPEAMAGGALRDAVLTPAVGTLPAAAELIAGLAEEAVSLSPGAPGRPPSPPDGTFGQLLVERLSGGGWRISTEGAPGPAVPLGGLTDWSRSDSAGRYRPLRGACTLPPGLRVDCPDIAALSSALEAIYPLAATHHEQHARGQLRVVSLREALGRQSGRYEVAGDVSERGAALARAELCGRCVKAPVWHGVAPNGAIPCPEPCSVMTALCREVALWERDAPPSATPDPTVPFAAFETPGNEIREAVLQSLKVVPSDD